MSDDYIRPDVQGFLAYLNSVPGPKIHEIGAPAARAQYLAMRALVDADRGDLAVHRDLSAGDVPVRLYDPREHREPGPIIVFFHGGGWVIGDLDSHDAFCAEMARQLDLPVVAVDYRLAPEHPWPAAPDDCEAAARWVASGPAELGRKPSALVLAGDSAGGNLTIVTAMALRDAPAAVPVIAQFPIYPATTDEMLPSYDQHAEGKFLTREGMDWFAEAYAAPSDDPRAHPLRFDQSNMPPTLVITASLDPIRDQGREYVAALARAGVPVTFREARGNIHGFISLRRAIPSSNGDVAGALAALKAIIVEAEGERVMAQAAAGADA